MPHNLGAAFLCFVSNPNKALPKVWHATIVDTVFVVLVTVAGRNKDD